mmetsp:Transcript_30771/g.95687  ORF Transcript_30771/g.95687 Transcript_30771/m.95687 type:complete len:209 (+) Transcript_30771:29-655(+)
MAGVVLHGVGIDAGVAPALNYAFSCAQAEASDRRSARPAESTGDREQDDVDELQQIRAARIAQMKQEREWRESGHGELRELADEVEFMDVMQPRARGVLLICDRGAHASSEQLLQILEDLARRHVEAQFCHLELENAGLLAHAVDLDEGVPVVMVVKHGKVAQSLPPSKLFARAAATSPKFRRHFVALLKQAGCIDADAKDEESDSEG